MRSIYWKLMHGINLWLSLVYLTYLFYGNESIFKSALAAGCFILFAYLALDCDMEAEKARMREEQA